MLPLFGEIHAWQLTFFIVGLPGLLISLLVFTVKEPVRRGLSKLSPTSGQGSSIPLAEVLRFLGQNRQTFAAHFSGFALLAIFGYGTALWIPEFIQRTHGWHIYDAGYAYGFIILFFGIGGVVSGGYLCDLLRKRNYSDAYLRATFFAALSLAPCAVLFPLTGSDTIMLVLLSLTTYFGAMPTGAAAAALQAVTPNEMRGQVSALYLFCVNLIGMGIGPGIVGFFTDFVFGDSGALNASLALTAAVTVPLAATGLWLGLPHFRRSVSDQEAVQAE
jgi:predicted MFS family arabinose efflux permease